MSVMKEQKSKKKFKRIGNLNIRANNDGICIDIAIIGMACRFPGADNYQEYWKNLENGISSIKEINRWNFDEHYSPNHDNDKSISKWCGLLDNIDKFDNEFFNISPREAIQMDPQQRILLEETWHCIEDAGIPLKNLQEKRTSVYVGAMALDPYNKFSSKGDIDIYSESGICQYMLPNRLSYYLGLSGESIVVEAACASSLVALSDAKKALTAGECDYSIVAGINLHFSPLGYLLWSKKRMLSLEGKCKTFDKDANGFVSGEGIGVLLLQPLDKAIQDKNHIHGVIRGAAVNHGGKAVSLSAPRMEAQRDVILAAYEDAGFDPETVSYVETHGTGTSLGDPIEIEALTKAFRTTTTQKQFCKIGSVKTNVGHLIAAAGMSGVIKVLMMMRHNKIPPSLNVKKINPIIDFTNSPFSIADSLTEWTTSAAEIPLRAGVSSFGLGGVNCHVLLEKYTEPTVEADVDAKIAYPFVLSAKNMHSLQAAVQEWRNFTKRGNDVNEKIKNVCLTMLTGRAAFPYRCGKLIKNTEELLAFLDNPEIDAAKNTTNASWGLRIGELSWKDVDVEVIIREFPLFKEKFNQILEYLDKCGVEQQIRDGLLRKNCSESFETLYSFILSYVYISTLIELGLPLDMVSGWKNGLWCSLAISGAVELQDVLEVLCGQKDWEQVKFTRPAIPFFDQSNQQALTRYAIDEAYVDNLLSVDIPDEIVLHYLEKTRSLINQSTFRKYLEEWDSKLISIGLHIREIIQDNEFLAVNNELLAKRKLLLMIIMLSSFARLNQKWGLSEEKLVPDERFYEFLDLILDQVICKEDLIFLLGGQQPDLSDIIATLNARQNRINSKKAYKYLHKHSQDSLAISDIKGWIIQQFALDQISALPERVCLDFGEMGTSLRADNTITFKATGDITAKFKDLLVDLWIKGVDISWNQLYPEATFVKSALPVYSFNRKSFWLSDQETLLGKHDEGKSELSHVFLHPFLQVNTSDLSEQRFSSTFTGQEFFLTDHIIKGQKVLPGVAYLEMARAAIEQATGELAKSEAQLCIKNVVWSRPIKMEGCPVKVNIGLYPQAGGEIAYEVYSQAEGADVVHGQGIVVMRPVNSRPVVDIKKLQTDCSHTLVAGEIYQAYSAMGFTYGPGHRGVETVYLGDNQVLAKLALPSSVAGTKEQFVLHPSLLDSALQAALALLMQDGTTVGKLALPFALRELEIFDKCSSSMWACIGYSKGSKAGDAVPQLDIDLCDEIGNICVRLRGLSFRVLEETVSASSKQEQARSLKAVLCWKEASVDQLEDAVPVYEQHVIALCEPKGIIPQSIEKQMNNAHCLVLKSEKQGIAERFQSYAVQLFEKVKSLLSEKHKGNILVQVVGLTQKEQQLFFGLSGLLKTAHLENPKLIGQLIGIEKWEEIPEIIEKLQIDSRRLGDTQIRYEGGKRWVAVWVELKDEREDIIPWKERGIYLITGGAGGLGRIFARDIAQKVKKATLILTGRSALSEEKQQKLKELESLGVEIEYKAVDVSRKEAVVEAIQSIKEQYGKLNGIIHGAGMIKDSFIIKKTKEEFCEVLSPKVTGLVNLDQASQEEELDFFVLFSSIAGGLGNIGQSDYATANAFMDVYAKYRNSLTVAQERKGRTLSINWPLWKEGGMAVDAQTEKLLMQSMGIIPMGSATGIEALYQGLSAGADQMLVMEGMLGRMKQKLFPENCSAQQIKADQVEFDLKNKVDKVQETLQQMAAELLKVKREDIDADTEFGEYGFDSITFTEFSNQLNQAYQLELAPTIFFEYPTLSSFAAYLVEEHQSAFAAQFVNKPKLEVVVDDKDDNEEVLFRNRRTARFIKTIAASTEQALQTGNSISEPIAIVGMSAIFPMAKDVNEYWKNLKEGRDCITEVPQDRWDWRKYYGDPKKDVNKTNSKWGGFIDSIAEFDPLFFGISPREAELMDPQQRLMITYVWKTIEDAGYSVKSLAGKNIGLFIGTMDMGYSRLLANHDIPIEGYTSTGRIASVGPNRISYLFDFHGPSEPVETACSSSLIAIHRAIGVIESGQCDMAIAGAVNTMPSPEYHISFSKAGMLSPDGRCKTFSANANGYVRGEGAGMIFLKKLKDAERAGDHIYGIIRGSAENHGGHANSLTAPNPKAQAEVLKKAYIKAGIDPRTVTYIEAHGTGTKLGDPIEINGLKSAFKDLYEMTGDLQLISSHCGLASVKSNIGHLELASGLAGLIKVLLQLKHKTLVKSLHCNSINPYIQLKDSPFYLVRENMDWKALKDDQGQDIPRRAGVSSFGFGGSNAHVVIEEYIPRKQPQSKNIDQYPILIVLSAQNNDCLREQARQLLTFIQNQKLSVAELIDVAYTLQVGRDAMEERLAMLVESNRELEQKLQGFLQGAAGIPNMYQGQAKRNKDNNGEFVQENTAGTATRNMSRAGYAKLLEDWANGHNFDWNQLYDDCKPNRISLPTYPFSKEHYWVSNAKQDVPVTLTSHGKFHFNEGFIEQLLDDVLDNVIGIDNAVQKIRAKGLI